MTGNNKSSPAAFHDHGGKGFPMTSPSNAAEGWVIGKTICARSEVDEVWFTRILDKGGVIVGEASGSSREESLYRAHLFKAAEAMKEALCEMVQTVDEPIAATATLQAQAIDAALLKCRAALRLVSPQEE